MSQSTQNPFVTDILNSIIGEATAIDFYTRLANAAPNSSARNDIMSIISDERDHFNLFSQLYIQMTGQQPVFQVTPVSFQSYRDGLVMAYRDELEDYEKYRNFYLMTQDQHLRDIFLRAFTDEIKHAVRFIFLMITAQ